MLGSAKTKLPSLLWLAVWNWKAPALWNQNYPNYNIISLLLYILYYCRIATSTKKDENSNHECSAIVQTKTEISRLISKSSPRTIFSAALRVKTRSLPKVERTRYSNSNNQSLMKISNIQYALRILFQKSKYRGIYNQLWRKGLPLLSTPRPWEIFTWPNFTSRTNLCQFWTQFFGILGLFRTFSDYMLVTLPSWKELDLEKLERNIQLFFPRMGVRRQICLTLLGHFNHPAVRNATSVTVRQHNSLSKY